MFPLRYFNPRYWAERYWAKTGDAPSLTGIDDRMGLCFGDIDNSAYYRYLLTMDGSADTAATVNAKIADNTLCPVVTALPTTPSYLAGGMATVRQHLNWDGRGTYRVDSAITCSNASTKSLLLDGHGARFTNNTGGNWIFDFPGGGYGSPLVHEIILRNMMLSGGGIRFGSGHKFRLVLDNVSLESCPSAQFAAQFGHQCYWYEINNVQIRNCAGGIKLPGVSSDQGTVKNLVVGWGGSLPDLQVNSSGCQILGGDFQARLTAGLAVPHIEIMPRDYTEGFTCNTTINNPVVTLASTAAFVAGDLIYLLTAGGYREIASVDSATQLTLTTNASATTTGSGLILVASQQDVVLDGLRFGGEATANGAPPAYCVRVGSSSVASVVRQRLHIRNCRVKARSDATGPSSTSSDAFVQLNRPVQYCSLIDNILSEGNTTTGKSFYSAVVKESFIAAGNSAANNHSNVYSRNQLFNFGSDLFSNGGNGWMPAS